MPADRVQALVGLTVDPRDEEARHRMHGGGVAAVVDQALETCDVRLGDFDVALQREDQRDVDAVPAGDHLLDCCETGLGGGDLDQQVRLVDLSVQAHGLLERRLDVERERGVDLHRDVPIGAVRRFPDGVQQIAGIGDVARREGDEDLLGVGRAAEHLTHLLVIDVTLGERLLEDGGVGRDADDGVIASHPLELAAVQQVA